MDKSIYQAYVCPVCSIRVITAKGSYYTYEEKDGTQKGRLKHNCPARKDFKLLKQSANINDILDSVKLSFTDVVT